jgi:hypothetical protein
MGYHRPVASFNTGKKGEYAERRFYRRMQLSAAAAGPEILWQRADDCDGGRRP